MIPIWKDKLASLEREVESMEHEVQQVRSSARALYDYGMVMSSEVDAYHKPLFRKNDEALNEISGKLPSDISANWDDDASWRGWSPDEVHEEPYLRIGQLIEKRSRTVMAPAFLPFIGARRTIIIKAGGRNADAGSGLLSSLVVRTALMMPHLASYTLLDPAGAGLAFPMRRYLPHVRESGSDVRRDLDQVIVDIQRIIESYLDASVTSFERVDHAIRVNERFQFVFAADFPNKYDRRAIEALQQIAHTGPAAGVYLFIHYNTDYELPRDMELSGFQNATVLDLNSTVEFNKGLDLIPDRAPNPERQTRVFEALKNAQPPERIIEWEMLDEAFGRPETWWQESAETVMESPIGVYGSNNKLKLWFGVNENGQTCAHGMLGAMTGSGKSNLYHVMIASLATRYGPDELRFYLIDGKDGVEFQVYRDLPHAEVVSLRSSPELSRSVVRELIDEKERRNDLFTQAAVRDFTAYRRKGNPYGKLPRILLLIDEYQELFEGDKDGLASNYLMQLAQQGRSAGIHMFLGSQQFGVAGMMNRQGIFGNFHLRAAMQMTSDDINALSEFGRKGKRLIAATCDLPGKIVVNDSSGDDTGNYAGKVAFLRASKQEKLLSQLKARAEANDCDLPDRVIFDGKLQPLVLHNPHFTRLLRSDDWLSLNELETLARRPYWKDGFDVSDWFAAEHPHIVWVGQDFNVRGQATIIYRRRAAENTVVVGDANSERYGMLVGLLTSLSVNASPGEIEFALLDISIPGTPWAHTIGDVYEKVLVPAGFSVEFTRESHQLEPILDQLLAELEKRGAGNAANGSTYPSIYFVATELDRVDAVRRKYGAFGMDESPLGQKLARLYVEGAPVGIHTILSFAGVSQLDAVIDTRRGLHHFRHRLALQMSEDHSHTIVRSRAAATLQFEGPSPVCALYFDVQSDYTLRFKPYTTKTQSNSTSESLTAQLENIGLRLAQRRNGQ